MEKCFQIICDCKTPIKLKRKFYMTTVRLAMLYGLERLAIKKHISKLSG